MLSLSLLLTSAGTRGALTTQELAAGQPSFLFILVRQRRLLQYNLLPQSLGCTDGEKPARARATT